MFDIKSMVSGENEKGLIKPIFVHIINVCNKFSPILLETPNLRYTL